MGFENDHTVFVKTRLYKMVGEGLFVDEDGRRYRPFGDLGYHCGPNILTGFKMAAGHAQQLFNTTWSRQRVFVEQGFGHITNTFKTHQFMPLQRPNVSRLSVWYMLSVLFTNCQVCLYGSHAATHFNCAPPSLEEYLKAWDKDEQFAAVFDRFRPEFYWMRLLKEDWGMYNTGTKEMREMGMKQAETQEHEEEEEEEEDGKQQIYMV
jgi:hypothetical protein